MNVERILARAGRATLTGMLLIPAAVAATAQEIESPVTVDTFFGAPAFTYRIEVPPGTGGMQPELELTYSSSLGESGLGQGWKISGLDCVELSTRFGVPAYNGTDPLTLSGEEVVDTGNGFFHTKIESFLRMEQFLQGQGNSYWIVTQRDGRKLRLGFDTMAEVPQGLPAVQTLRWHLDQVSDPHGNSLRAEYDDLGDAGVLYPTRIEYTLHGGQLVGPAREVVFTWESRPDIYVDFSAGFEQRRSHRLASISTTVGASLVKRYDLAYTADPNTGRSLLTSIQEIGSDGSTPGPMSSFDYGSASNGFHPVASWYGIEGPVGGGSEWRHPQWLDVGSDSGRLDLFDMNGDGFSDRVRQGYVDPITEWAVQAGHGAGFDSYAPWPNVWSPYPNDRDWSAMWASVGGAAFVALVDMDADGLLDRLLRDPTDFALWTFQRNHGSGFDDPVAWPGVEDPSASSHEPQSGWKNMRWNPDGTGDWVQLLDMNGDGLPDRLTCGPQDVEAWWVQFGTGSGFDGLQPWTGVVSPSTSSDWSRLSGTHNGQRYNTLIDMNGDGLPDRVLRGYADGGAEHWTVQFNKGDGFAPPVVWPGVAFPENGPDWKAPAYGDNGVARSSLRDMNGDGLPDRVWSYEGNGWSSLAWGVQFNSGFGFQAPIAWSGAWSPHPGDIYWNSFEALASNGATTDVYLIDLNADGMPDRIVKEDGFAEDEWRVQINASRPTWLLRQVQLPTKGLVDLEYAPATWFDNTTPGGESCLASPFAVVTSMTVSDGLGGSESMAYEYSGGLYDAEAREFRGFARTVVTDPAGNTSELDFHQEGELKGRQISSERRDATGALYARRVNEWSSVETFPLHGVFEVTLDSQTTTVFDGDATSVTERVEYEYDAHGNVTERRLLGDPTDPGDDLTHLTEYVANTSSVWIVGTPRFAQVRDANGTVVTTTEFFYDGATDSTQPPTAGLLTRQVEGLGTLLAEVDMTYDAHGNLRTTEDELGRVTTLIYDASNTFPATIVYPLGQSESFTHDPGTGQVLTGTDRNGLTTTNAYDVLGRLVRSYGPEDPVGNPDLPGVEMVYDTTAVPCRVETRIRRVSASTDPAHVLTSYAFYDGFGRKVQLRQPDGDPSTQIVEDTVYDGGGRVLRKSHPYREATSAVFPPGGPDPTHPSEIHTYDLMGRTVLITHPDLSTVATNYDDRVVTRTDENGETVEFVYDAHGRMASVRERLDPSTTFVTSYEYDALGNLTRMINAKGDVTSLTYDALSRKVASDDMDLGAWTYEYDLADNLVARTDARGVRVEFTYDELNRMTSRTFPSDPPVHYTYDSYPTGVTPGPFAVGQRTHVEDGSGSTAFYYDARGHVSVEERTVAGEGVFRIEREFDALGNLVDLVYPDAERVTFEFDAAGRACRAHGPGDQPVYVEEVEYDPSGQKTFVEYGNGVRTSYAYDALTRRLLALTTEDDSATALQSFEYNYDAAGNVLSITDSMPPGPGQDLSQGFQYDALHRLVRADGHFDDGLGGDAIDYEYDAVGNMIRRGDRSFRYGPVNGPANGFSKGTHGFRAIHDANGNTTGLPGRLFQYDEDNRLRSAQVLPSLGGPGIFPDDPIPPDSIAQSLAVEFLYDGDGGRVRKTDSLGGKTVYVGNAYELRDGRPIRHVYLGAERVATIETPTATNPDPDDLFHHPDHIGSASLITNQDGDVVDSIAYFPFGSDASLHADHATPYLYTGKERDGETGLYFMEARYFAPFLCRFITPDEVARDLSDPQSLNRYAYSRNNPLRYSDPSGNFFLELLVGYFLAQNETVQQFIQQTERNFIRPLTHNPSQYLRDHRAQLRDAAIAAGVAVVGSLITGVSGGGALPVLVGALKYATTSLILSTPGGQEGISRLADGLQQVGVSPRVSYIAAGAMGSVALNGTADQLLEGFGLDAMRSVNRFDVDLVKEQSLAQLGLQQVEPSQGSLTLNALKGFSARSIIDETVSLTGVLPAQEASLLTGALDLLSAAPDSLLSRHMGSVLVQLELSWSGAAHAAVHGTLGYRLGRETSEAFRNDVPLRRQLLQQATMD